MGKKKKKKIEMKKMVELSFYSVAENKKELIKELQDLAWRLEYGSIRANAFDPLVKHNIHEESWAKLNYGCRSLKVNPIEVKPTMDDCLNLLN